MKHVLASLLILSMVLLPMGCTSSQIAVVEAVVNVVLSAAGNLAAAFGNEVWAADLITASAALKQAEANFVNGTGTEVAIANAAMIVEDVLAEVAPGSKASILVDILVAALDACLAILPAPTITAARHPHWYNHHGMAIGHRLFRSKANDFKAAWNAEAVKVGVGTL
jgi:hypothetical protein